MYTATQVKTHVIFIEFSFDFISLDSDAGVTKTSIVIFMKFIVLVKLGSEINVTVFGGDPDMIWI